MRGTTLQVVGGVKRNVETRRVESGADHPDPGADPGCKAALTSACRDSVAGAALAMPGWAALDDRVG